MSDIEKLRKFTIGCGIVVMVLWSLPFLWSVVKNQVRDYQASRPAEPGSPGEFDQLIGSNQVEQAWQMGTAQYRAVTDAARKQEFRQRLERTVYSVYDARKRTQGSGHYDTIYRQLVTDFPEGEATLSSHWKQDRSRQVQDLIRGKDWDGAWTALETMRAASSNAVDAHLAGLYESYLRDRWQNAMWAGLWDEAEAQVTAVMKVPGYGETAGVKRQYQDLLRQRFARDWSGNDMAALDPVYDRWLAVSIQLTNLTELADHTVYLADRFKRCTQRGDAKWPQAFFDAAFAYAGEGKRPEVVRLFQDYSSLRWRTPAATNNFAAADAVMAEFPKQGERLGAEWCGRQYGDYLALRWQAARKAGRAADARHYLEQAVTTYATYVDAYQVALGLQREYRPVDLLARAKDEMARNRPGVARFFLYAIEMLDSQVVRPAGAAALYEDCLVALAREKAALALTTVKPEDRHAANRQFHDALFDPDRDARRPDSLRRRTNEWVKVVQEYLNYQVQMAGRLIAKKEFFDAQVLLDSAARSTAVTLWEVEWERTAGDPWKTVPVAVLAKVNAQVPADATPQTRFSTLRYMAQKGEFDVPQARPALELSKQIREQQAVAMVEEALRNLSSELLRDKSFDALRKTLREYPGTAASDRARRGLQEAIHSAGIALDNAAGADKNVAGNRGFGFLSDLLAFYVAEVGVVEAGDPFVQELQTKLQAAADACKTTAPRSRVFFLSLLADLVPDAPAGKEARREAMALGFQLMDSMASEGLKTPDLRIPSLLKGMSVTAIENHTPYHLMAFVRGPERFMVRLGPYRRGVAVHKDGTYDVAVIVATEEVKPFRGRSEFSGEYQQTSYRVVLQDAYGTVRSEEGYAPSTGDFTLLRAPPDAGTLSVHAESGFVTRK